MYANVHMSMRMCDGMPAADDHIYAYTHVTSCIVRVFSLWLLFSDWVIASANTFTCTIRARPILMFCHDGIQFRTYLASTCQQYRVLPLFSADVSHKVVYGRIRSHKNESEPRHRSLCGLQNTGDGYVCWVICLTDYLNAADCPAHTVHLCS